MTEIDQTVQLKEQRLLDRLKTRELMQQMVDAGDILKDSHVVLEGALDQTDIDKLHRYLVTGVPITETNYRLIDHLKVVSDIAGDISDRLIAANPQQYGALSRFDVQAAALLHDDGKRASFKWYHNEIAGDIVAEKIGVRQDILSNMPGVKYDLAFMETINGTYTPDDVERYIEGLSVEKRIITIADILGKRDVATWTLQKFDDVMKYHYASRGAVIDKVNQTSSDPSRALKTFASERMITPELIDFTGAVYERLMKWLYEEGIDPDNLQQALIERERHSPVQALIVDIGGVVIDNPDTEIIARVEKETGASWSDIEPIWVAHIQKVRTGKMSEADFLLEIQKQISISRLEPSLLAGWNVQFHQDVVSLLQKYKTEHTFKLVALTDTIPSHETILREAGVADLFDEFIPSTEVGVTKSTKTSFIIAALKEWLSPQACILIDDIEANLEVAKQAHMKVIQFRTAAQMEEDVARLAA